MLLTTSQLFENAYNTTEEVLTETQKGSAFSITCSIFFDEVSIFLSVDETKPLDEEIARLKQKYGNFEVLEVWDKKIEVIPEDDYANFKLGVKYHADFLMVAESVILTTSLKNLNMLKNIGIDEAIQQVPIDYQSIRELLRKRHNIGHNSLVRGE